MSIPRISCPNAIGSDLDEEVKSLSKTKKSAERRFFLKILDQNIYEKNSL